MPSPLYLLLDAILLISIVVLLYLVHRKIVSPKKNIPVLRRSEVEKSRELLEKKQNLLDEQQGIKEQFLSGELDTKHFRLTLNHNVRELAVVERQLGKLGMS